MQCSASAPGAALRSSGGPGWAESTAVCCSCCCSTSLPSCLPGRRAGAAGAAGALPTEETWMGREGAVRERGWVGSALPLPTRFPGRALVGNVDFHPCGPSFVLLLFA